uniref:Pleiotropic regulator 1 n=1 Tax=Strigamia maritima TaxID=126957 RepID=T1IU65_STRMM
MEVLGPQDVQKHSVHTLVFRSLKRTHDMFLSDQSNPPAMDEKAEEMKMAIKKRDEYQSVVNLVNHHQKANHLDQDEENIAIPSNIDPESSNQNIENSGMEMTVRYEPPEESTKALVPVLQSQSLLPRRSSSVPKPKWHPPWKLFRVISGHLGWVRSVTVEPGNQWFATGSADRVIKIWDLASGKLKLSLTGHISAVRGLAVSSRQPYLFSCGEDKQVKCWDLEYNKVIRHYHGHLSAVYSLALHPTIDVLITCGRDSTARVWDMRSKANIHTLSGHTNTVSQVVCQSSEPQIITGSHDCTIRLWDLAAGKSITSLTNHKKSVRTLAFHPKLYMFASGSPDNIKQWKCPDGKFVQNLSGHNAIVNCLAVNSDGVFVSGGDNGTLFLWDWKTGYNFQRIQAPVQPGSIESEAGIFSCCFDHSGTRLITTEADKTIKIYREDETATEESHPINWKPEIFKRRLYLIVSKKYRPLSTEEIPMRESEEAENMAANAATAASVSYLPNETSEPNLQLPPPPPLSPPDYGELWIHQGPDSLNHSFRENR